MPFRTLRVLYQKIRYLIIVTLNFFKKEYNQTTRFKPPKLSIILSNLENLRSGYSLYAKKESPLTANTECMIVDDNELENEGTLFLRGEGFVWTIAIEDVRGVVLNARRQLPQITTPELINALNFWLKNDTFIEM